MNTIRNKHEADKAINDLVMLTFLQAKRQEGHTSDAVCEALVMLLRELARTSPLAKTFVEQRVATLRKKQNRPELSLSEE